MPQSSESKKERREARRAAGLCTMCGNRPPMEEGGSTCETCRGYFKTYHDRKEAAGGCRKCGSGVPQPGNKNCDECLRKQREYIAKLRYDTIMAYGGYRCACPGCTVTEPEFLQLDHINNDGNVHRKLLGSPGGDRLYRWLKNHGYPPIMQVLCANCNYAKAHYGRCPHQPHREVNDAPTRRVTESPTVTCCGSQL